MHLFYIYLDQINIVTIDELLNFACVYFVNLHERKNNKNTMRIFNKNINWIIFFNISWLGTIIYSYLCIIISCFILPIYFLSHNFLLPKKSVTLNLEYKVSVFLNCIRPLLKVPKKRIRLNSSCDLFTDLRDLLINDKNNYTKINNGSNFMWQLLPSVDVLSSSANQINEVRLYFIYNFIGGYRKAKTISK